ncbi:Methicillin resistance mecR1 protein [Symmachiella dynata]|uniref:Methicillin resistance mecR1 protein n=1 Tax=Symmachiella dynata TaxID=2527995 RepID=A0A517ZMB0_9PLAN|nr:M56 family metallopeptidase [Symmachiella dynata]QDU43614.1 Methicillin resistance mecR1 protein [Symmachiella dynata]
MNFVSALNEMSHVWFDQMRNSLVDTTILLGVVSAVWLLLRKRLSAQVGCCLFLLVLVKAAIPLEIPGPSWLAALSPRQQWQQWVETSPPASTNHVAPPPVNPHDLQPIASTTIDTVASTPGLATTTNTDTQPTTIAPAATPLAINTQQQPTLTTAAWLMILWGSTACAMLMRFAWIHIQFHRRLRSATRVVDDVMLIDLEKLRRAAGVRQTVRYFVTNEISSPAVWGILRPCLLLPSGFTQTYSPKQIQWIVLHEFAHIRHGDLWIALFQRLVQMLHVFNPAVWIANGMIHRLQEYACDDAALLAADVSRRDCGNALLRAVEAAQTRPPVLDPALGIFRPGRVFRNRLIRILDTKRPVTGRITSRSTLFLILLAAIVLPRVRANDDPAAEQPAQPQPAAPTEFFAELPNGGTVELVGISEHPSKDRPWWRADGSPLETAPYAHPGGRYHFGRDMIGREFAFRFHGVPENLVQATTITLIGSGGSGSLSVPVDQAGHPLENMRVKLVSLPQGTQQSKFRISVPNGDWQLIATSNGNEQSASAFTFGGFNFGVTFMPGQIKGNDIVLNFAHNAIGHEVRVVAVEADGQTRHVQSRFGGVGAAGFYQATAEFEDLKGKNIVSFHVEVRKTHNITFEHIAAAPGEQAKFNVVGAAPGWGAFSGQFLFDGLWPEPKVLVEKGDMSVKDAAISAAQTIRSEELIVDKKTLGIKNVFVYLKNPPSEIHPSLIRRKSKKVVFDAIGRRFLPHALIAQTDQTILLKNADPIPSNVHTRPSKNSPYNLALRPQDRSGAAVMFNKPEPAPFPVSSDYHRWMKAHWLILDHPYAAITDRQGKFEINNLPAGQHEFVVWHEKYGWLEKSLTIEIKAGKTVKMAPRKIGS